VAAGYCYLNNAAIAAQAFTNDGAKRVAVLDVDYHHGNGTQDIFYDRNDVLFVSIHADPAFEYPSSAATPLPPRGVNCRWLRGLAPALFALGSCDSLGSVARRRLDAREADGDVRFASKRLAETGNRRYAESALLFGW
jgi:hypothetical protein